MRILVFIAVILSMTFSPAMALSSCAAMGLEAIKMEITGDDQHKSMDVMGASDCDGMNNDRSQNHDAGCVAACALACPGFYLGPDFAADREPVFRVVKYAIPQVDPGLAVPSHLDPPPPRI